MHIIRISKTHCGVLLGAVMFARYMSEGCFVMIGGLSLYSLLFQKASPVVTISDGQLQGHTAFSRGGHPYFEYLGIPYAEPPVGNLRFESPVPGKSWTGVKQASLYPPPCAQMDGMIYRRAFGVEDCLYLNVFTASVDLNMKQRPVLAYIHGGGFFSGATNQYPPQYFMDEEIVVVTIQYRLGPFGFLNTGDDLIRGNMGLKDQVLALKWIQKNIAHFGGDPEQVTLVGESAGAASVQHHMISKASRGLFQRAIAQSGSALCPWALMEHPRKVTFDYGKLLGCPSDNSSVLVQCLRKMNALDVTRPQLLINNPLSGFQLLLPSVETVIRDDAFLTERPLVNLLEGRYMKVPLIIGRLTAEGGLVTARFDAEPQLVKEVDSKWDLFVHSGFGKLNNSISKGVRRLYFGSGPIAKMDFNEFKEKWTRMVTDAGFSEPVNTAAFLHAQQGAPTYQYVYDFHSSSLPAAYSIYKGWRHNDWLPVELRIFQSVTMDWLKSTFLGRSRGPRAIGLTHADDVTMLWSPLGVVFSMWDLSFSRSFVKLFADFAKNKELEFRGVPWPAIVPNLNSSMQYMLLRNEPKFISEALPDFLKFWQTLRFS